MIEGNQDAKGFLHYHGKGGSMPYVSLVSIYSRSSVYERQTHAQWKRVLRPGKSSALTQAAACRRKMMLNQVQLCWSFGTAWHAFCSHEDMTWNLDLNSIILQPFSRKLKVVITIFIMFCSGPSKSQAHYLCS